VLGEASAGVESRSPSEWAVEYLARCESAELRSEVGSPSFLWGSVELAKAFRCWRAVHGATGTGSGPLS
jgi:hypothetical protein